MDEDWYGIRQAIYKGVEDPEVMPYKKLRMLRAVKLKKSTIPAKVRLHCAHISFFKISQLWDGSVAV